MTHQPEAYRPAIADGRGIFPEDVKAKAPLGMRKAIAMAAERRNMTHAEYIRQALLRVMADDGVKLRRGLVELNGEAA